MSTRVPSSGPGARGRAVLTGATGGIGGAFARELAAQGYALLLVGRNEGRLEKMARDLHHEHGVEVETLAADLTQEDAVRMLEDRITSDPQLTLLVNCAGAAPWGRVDQIDCRRQEDAVRLNVLAPLRLTRAAVKKMVERKSGGIINVSSLAGFMALPYCATYGGTKAFLISFTEALHEELRGTGVHVQALCPGFVLTELFAREGADMEKLKSEVPSFVWVSPETVARGSLAALRRNRAIVTPSIRHRFLGVMLRLLPRKHLRRGAADQFGKFNDFRREEDPPADEAQEAVKTVEG